MPQLKHNAVSFAPVDKTEGTVSDKAEDSADGKVEDNAEIKSDGNAEEQPPADEKPVLSLMSPGSKADLGAAKDPFCETPGGGEDADLSTADILASGDPADAPSESKNSNGAEGVSSSAMNTARGAATGGFESAPAVLDDDDEDGDEVVLAAETSSSSSEVPSSPTAEVPFTPYTPYTPNTPTASGGAGPAHGSGVHTMDKSADVVIFMGDLNYRIKGNRCARQSAC